MCPGVRGYLKTVRVWLPSFLLLAVGICGGGIDALAQAYPKSQKGLSLYEAVEGSSNSLGQIIRWDSSVGYNFNKHFAIDAGIPVYFIRSSGQQSPPVNCPPRGCPPGTIVPDSLVSSNGLGNVFIDLNFTFDNRIVNYAAVVTGTLPTGDRNTGLSTGRVTIDWTNHLDRSFGRWTPFLDVGIANTISDTPFFVRPFSTLGFVSHYEGGFDFDLWKFFNLGASVYDVLPTGQQKVFSRVIRRQQPPTTALKVRHGRVFSGAPEIVGNADLDRDNGFSVWLAASPWRFLDLEAGYTRSVRFDLNSIFFGVGVNIGFVLRKARGR